MRSDLPTELDLSLIHALEVNPRASWKRLGEALGVAPVTAQRRWARLADVGAAWIAVLPDLVDMASAVVKVDCAAGHKRSVATAVCAHRQAFTVEITGGSSDLVVTVVTSTAQKGQQYILDELDGLPGVVCTRVAQVTEWFSEGNQWRIGALDREKENQIAARTRHRAGAAADVSMTDRALINLLSTNGRLSYQELGDRTGLSAATAGRRIDRMLRMRILSLRCELANSVNGSPMHACLDLVVPPIDLRRIGRALATWRQVRMCIGVADEANLRVSVWLRRPNELIDFEERLMREFPELAVRGRTLDLDVVKRVGHVLDERGYSHGVVPCAAWD